jgi:hypothetical protein
MTSIKLIALTIVLASATADASLFRWVDDNGKVHFSDKIPPSIAQKGHTSLTKHGVESEVVSSSDELKRQHEEKQKEKKAETDKTASMLAEEEQKRKDDLLLATYESRSELIGAFNRKISLIDQSVEISTAREENLVQKIARLNKQLKGSKGDVRQLTLSLQAENAESTLAEYREAIRMSRVDKKILTRDYKETLSRFDKLTQVSE